MFCWWFILDLTDRANLGSFWILLQRKSRWVTELLSLLKLKNPVLLFYILGFYKSSLNNFGWLKTTAWKPLICWWRETKIITARCDTCYVFNCYNMLMPAERRKQGILPEGDWQSVLKEVRKEEREKQRKERAILSRRNTVSKSQRKVRCNVYSWVNSVGCMVVGLREW